MLFFHNMVSHLLRQKLHVWSTMEHGKLQNDAKKQHEMWNETLNETQ